MSGFSMPSFSGPCRVLKFDADKCVGCNLCVDACPLDVMIPNPEPGLEPIVVFAEECWFCGGGAAGVPSRRHNAYFPRQTAHLHYFQAQGYRRGVPHRPEKAHASQHCAPFRRVTGDNLK